MDKEGLWFRAQEEAIHQALPDLYLYPGSNVDTDLGFIDP